jgi:vitamin B12 transporter
MSDKNPNLYSRLVRKIVVATSIVLLPIPLIAQADQAGQSRAAIGIEEEIIVVGSLEETIPLQLSKYGNRVKIITAQEIELGGFNDLGQSLQMLVPGLYLAPKNGAFDYMNCSLQGSRCQDILWLIDGVRINNRLYNTTSPLDTVPAHMVERVEVLYGGQGIFYGTQSVGGVINVVTKAYTDETAGGVGVGFDENDGTHINADVSGGNGRQSFVLYGSYDDADGFQPFDSSAYQASGTDRERGYEVATLGAKYRIELNDAAKLSLMYHRTENEVEWASPANRSRSFNEREEDLATVKLDYQFNESVDLFVKAYYHDWDSRWTRRDNELDGSGQLTGNVLLVSDEEFWGYEDYGLMTMAEIQGTGGFDYSVGFDHQRYSGRDDVLLIADDTEDVNAVFGQIRSNDTLLQNTSVALGVRYNKPSGEGDITVWNLSGQHNFSDTLYLRSTLGTSFRFPDAWQLYGNDPCCTQGNPDLEGEESENINLALGGRLDVVEGLNWELILFKRQVDNLIGSAAGVRINSDAEVDFDGFEISLNLQASEALSLGLDYTNTDAEADGSSQQITDVPESILKFNATYQPPNFPIEISGFFQC